MAGSASQPARRIVIPMLAGVGNSVMTVPMVRQIKQAWPDCRITILARNPAFGEPFKRLSEVDEVLYTGVGIKALFRAVTWTRQRKPDMYLVPYPSSRWHYGLLALLSGAKRKILNRYPVGRIKAFGWVGQRVPPVSGVHDVIQNLRLINALGIETDESEIPRFPLTDADRARATQILSEVDLPPDASFIAIHAGSGKTPYTISKRWPTDNYAELVRRLRSEFPHELLILEGPDERDIAKEIFIRAGEPAGVHVVQLKGPLGEAAALLERAALYAGSDSGLAHLAAAVGNRAVTIFAPADPDRVCPYGSRDLVVKPDKPCSPCSMYPMECTYPKVKCTPPFCISEVTVDQVMQKVRSALNLVPSQSVRG